MLRNLMLGGVSHFAMLAPDGVEGGGSDEVVVDQGQGAPSDAAATEDDGFTAEERTQFEQMQREPAAPAPDAPDPAAAAAKPEAGEGEGEGDEGDDDAGDGAAGDAAGAEAGADGQKRRRRVNIKTYERDVAARDARIKELEAAQAESMKMQAVLDERMRIINEALTPQQQAAREEEDPEPDPEADIFAHNAWLKRQVISTREELKKLGSGIEQQQTESNLDEWYASDSRAFIAKQPDFLKAYNFMLNSRVRELGYQRFGKDFATEDPTPQEAAALRQAMQREERQLVEIAARNKRSAAQLIYGMALSRNYVPEQAGQGAGGGAKAAADAAAGAAVAAASGAAPAAGAKPNGNGKPSVSEEIRNLKAGVESSLSLSSGGGAPAMALTAEKLANMDQDDFNALADQLSEQDWKRVAGGR